MKKTIQKNVIGVVSLGCDKNRVDLEKMIAKLSQAGYIITTNLNEAYIALINTCSFILDARKESIESILRAATLKSANLKHIVVTGCLNNMRYTDLHESLPEVDKFVPIT
ncbi:MAG: 30S ribosomal protein S12 methylthiotransferase RimO, partial [Clostridia bacterium]|nr:30S ribosomal protein S12 methylthiotransferase RimO [Clostridia bacterium]